MSRVVLKASDLDGYLTEADKERLGQVHELYDEALESFGRLESSRDGHDEIRERLIILYNTMGDLMKEVTAGEPAIHVYSFETPRSTHGEVSRLIAKLRDTKTRRQEFVYYTQRAYELLFNFAVTTPMTQKKNYIISRTPVTVPVQNYSVHKIPNVDSEIGRSVMCVMLRGALLPSMIMSKEIQEYSSSGYTTPFALFRIKRDDTRQESDMEYILDLDRSFFDLRELDGKDLVFADPMNATGGSLVTIITYLLEQGVRPASIRFFNIISALKGSLRIIRALENVSVYTLWMDPVLNDKAYIMPGLGDAGDRINGSDEDDHPRNIIQLIANYGSNIAELYRSQVQKIEETVLGA
jgi:uracil phosphoribosyltransferase